METSFFFASDMPSFSPGLALLMLVVRVIALPTERQRVLMPEHVPMAAGTQLLQEMPPLNVTAFGVDLTAASDRLAATLPANGIIPVTSLRIRPGDHCTTARNTRSNSRHERT